MMLAKLTSKNQLTLPKAAVEATGNAEYFEIEARAGQLVLTPVRLQRADAVRAKLAELDLADADLAAAVAWARQAAAPGRSARVAESKTKYRAEPARKRKPSRSTKR
jgi:enoyl-CoA hydratase/carnithine racemase